VAPGAEKSIIFRQVGEQKNVSPGSLVTKSIATPKCEPAIAEVSIAMLMDPADPVPDTAARKMPVLNNDITVAFVAAREGS